MTYDLDFLKNICEQQERVIYAQIIALDINENPIEEITGKVTGGGINVDGDSSTRRTFSLNMVANEVNINDYYWGLNSKMRLRVGISNNVDSSRPDVVWFDQGVFVITSFNTSLSQNSYSISIQGKDKMSLLNGEVGGVIESLTAEFSEVEVQSRDKNGKLLLKKEKIPIKDIIREAVHKYANEPYGNIIINDLEDMGLELMEFRGKNPMYLIIDEQSNEVENIRFDGEFNEYRLVSDDAQIALKDIPVYNPRLGAGIGGNPLEVTKVYSIGGDGRKNVYSISKISKGEVCGYRLTDITYPGELKLQVGANITSMLDSIVKFLGDFEYFYDVKGRFIFQRKKIWVKTKFDGLESDGLVDTYEKVNIDESNYIKNFYYIRNGNNYVLSSSSAFSKDTDYYQKVDEIRPSSQAETSSLSYYFGDSRLVTSFSNSPNISSLKNDFSIWGEKITSSGGKIPIHIRYAISEKPTSYRTYDGKTLYSVRPQKEILDEIVEKNKIVKTPNKNGLPETWWDVHEWAEIYKVRTGEYPKDHINEYCEPTRVVLNDYFEDKGEYAGEIVETDDIFYDTETNIVTDIHYRCTHSYTYYIEIAKNGIGAYIHDPQIPDSVLTDMEKDVLYDKDLKIVSNLDWREILYQMAVDYQENHEKEDYFIKVYNNNIDFLKSAKGTGYEQFYTDMLGFWRDVYNPNPPKISSPTPNKKTYYKWNSVSKNYDKVTSSSGIFKKPLPLGEDLYYKTDSGYLPYSRKGSRRYYKKVKDSLKMPKEVVRAGILKRDISKETSSKMHLRLYEVEEGFRIGYDYYRDKGIIYSDVLEKGYEYFERDEQGRVMPETRIYLPKDQTYYIKDVFPGTLNYKFSKVDTLHRGYDYYIKENGEFRLFFSYSEGDRFYRDQEIEIAVSLKDYHENKNLFLKEVKNDGAREIKSVLTKDNLIPLGEELAVYEKIPREKLSNGVYYSIEKDEKDRYHITTHRLLVEFEDGKEYYIKRDGQYELYSQYRFSNEIGDVYESPQFNLETGWTLDLSDDPSKLNFWIDFLDSKDSDISKYSIQAVGNRTKAVNDNKITSIYYRDTPCVIFVKQENWEKERDVKPGFTYVKMPQDLEASFFISSQGKTAHGEVENFLYDFSYCTESVSMTTIPIYHLEPNTRISIRDDKSGINGEYIVNKISIPLTFNGMMNISGIKAVNGIY